MKPGKEEGKSKTGGKSKQRDSKAQIRKERVKVNRGATSRKKIRIKKRTGYPHTRLLFPHLGIAITPSWVYLGVLPIMLQPIKDGREYRRNMKDGKINLGTNMPADPKQ